ncbi:MAG: rod-binding protein [Desulfobacterota bacterium]|nr:rod-binding protein [Thermodesulfobacteriota bacterium]
MPIKPMASTVVQLPPAAETGRGGKKMDPKKLRQAGEDFEALFINQLLQTMRRTIFPAKIMGEAPGKDIYQSLFDRELSKKMAHQGGLGLGKVLVQKVLEKEKGRAGQETGASPPVLPVRTGGGSRL